MKYRYALAVFALLSSPLVMLAQDSPSSASATGAVASAASAPVPRLLRYSGAAKTSDGRPWSGTAALTFAIYAEQQDGTPLWMETQNAESDAQGHYAVLLGSTRSEGMRVDLFTAGEPRWLGVRVEMPGEVEQPRVLLVSVPYAMKASDADTLGGLPASAYMVAPSATSDLNPYFQSHPGLLTGLGTPGFLAMFTDSRTLGDSVLFAGNGLVGIGTAQPAHTLDVHGTAGFTGAVTFGSPVTFAPGQTFPGGGGAGSITGVTAGTGLSGGGTSGNVTLNLNTAFTDARYAQLGTANIFTGAIAAPSFTGNGAGLAGVNAATLGGLAPSAFVQSGSTTSPVTQSYAGAVNVQGNVSLAPLNGVNPTFTVQDANGSTFSVTSLATFLTAVGSGGTISPTDLTTASGGAITIQGNSGTTNGTTNGSSVSLIGGQANGGAGGSINLTPGTGATTGFVNVNGSLNVTGTVTCGSGCSGGGSGSGTVTSVGSGFGLTGGPITTAGTLTIDTSVVPQLGGPNAFTGNNTFTGANTFNGSFNGNGAGLSNVNALTLGGNLPSAFATTGANAFTGNQSVTGNVSLTGSLTLPNTTSPSVGVIYLGTTPFLHNFPGTSGSFNTFVGASAGNMTMDTVNAIQNTAVGAFALSTNTTGYDNAAFGYKALSTNAMGADNSAFGGLALAANTAGAGSSAFGFAALNAATGTNNSAFGSGALEQLTSGTFNIAIGSSAGNNLVSNESNNIDIGNPGLAGDMNTIRIGNSTHTTTYIAGMVNASGQQTFSVVPAGNGVGQGSLFIDPASVPAGPPVTLLGAAVGGTQEMLLDSSGDLTLAGSLTLPNTTSSTVGVINLGTTRFLHNFPGTSASFNTFVGASAGNMTMDTKNAVDNTAVGANALFNNTTGDNNSAFGVDALVENSIGHSNSAFGSGALGTNDAGAFNSAFGYEALNLNQNSDSAAFGSRALSLSGGARNSAFGSGALGGLGGPGGGGDYNIAIGQNAGGNLTSGSNNIYIGNLGPTLPNAMESGMIRIGDPNFQTATYLTGNVVAQAYTDLATGINVGLSTSCSLNQVMEWSGSAWACATVSGGGGGGTVTNVTAGAGLHAIPSNPITSTGTLTIDPTVVPQLGAGNNTFAGAITASSFTGSGAGLSNVNAVTLGGNLSTAFATLGPNTFSGDQTITGNVTASGGVTVGSSLALPNTTSPTTGSLNVGVITFGGDVFLHNYGIRNTFVGGSAGNRSTSGPDNTGVGFDALGSLAGSDATMAFSNSAFGSGTLMENTTGFLNSAFGAGALETNAQGFSNSAFGEGALDALKSGSNNIAIGKGAGGDLFSNESFDIYIGNVGTTMESKTIRIGDGATQTAAYITGISGATIASGTAVMVASNGQLGTITSSRRYKHDIADMSVESDLLMKLRPVAFYYKPELDATQTRQYGLVAEEVAKVAPGLVVFDKDGQPETVRYHFVNAMLLNEVQKQQRSLEEQQRVNQQQQNTIARQGAEIQDLAARLAKLEALLARSTDSR
jgi:trimeric autotransporter adhesin